MVRFQKRDKDPVSEDASLSFTPRGRIVKRSPTGKFEHRPRRRSTSRGKKGSTEESSCSGSECESDTKKKEKLTVKPTPDELPDSRPPIPPYPNKPDPPRTSTTPSKPNLPQFSASPRKPSSPPLVPTSGTNTSIPLPTGEKNLPGTSTARPQPPSSPVALPSSTSARSAPAKTTSTVSSSTTIPTVAQSPSLGAKDSRTPSSTLTLPPLLTPQIVPSKKLGQEGAQEQEIGQMRLGTGALAGIVAGVSSTCRHPLYH